MLSHLGTYFRDRLGSFASNQKSSSSCFVQEPHTSSITSPYVFYFGYRNLCDEGAELVAEVQKGEGLLTSNLVRVDILSLHKLP